jgi:hypothetical protein
MVDHIGEASLCGSSLRRYDLVTGLMLMPLTPIPAIDLGLSSNAIPSFLPNGSAPIPDKSNDQSHRFDDPGNHKPPEGLKKWALRLAIGIIVQQAIPHVKPVAATVWEVLRHQDPPIWFGG